jgi:hypothetical protein
MSQISVLEALQYSFGFQEGLQQSLVKHILDSDPHRKVNLLVPQTLMFLPFLTGNLLSFVTKQNEIFQKFLQSPPSILHLNPLHISCSLPYLGKSQDSELQTPHHHTSVLLSTLILTTVLKIYTKKTITVPSIKSVVFLSILFPLAHRN